MPVDIHTHPHRRTYRLAGGDYNDYDLESELLPNGTFKDGFVEEFLSDMAILDTVVVLAVAAPGYWISASNEFIAAFADACGSKVVGFASVNPNSDTAVPDVERAVKELGLGGVKLGPIYQNFDPADLSVYPLYEKIQELDVPIIWHQGTSMAARFGPLESSNPVLLDKILREFPDIKMIFSHLSYPWSMEAIIMAGKHPQLFVDVSAMAARPWFLYNAMVAAMEYGCLDKIIFGSDYPWYTPEETRDALYAVSEASRGTNLPSVPLEALEEIFLRDSAQLLGI